MKRISLIIIILTFVICNLSFPVWGDAQAPDATQVSIGARILGMGRAYIGLADDVGSIYANPAGLGNLTNWQISSMSGNFMEDFSYINLSGGYPTNLGVIGVGLTSSTIAGGYSTKIVPGTEADPVYEIDPTQPSISYFNNLLILSYGNKVPMLPFNALFGASVKIYSAGLSGDGITNGNASGNEIDAGILAKPLKWLTLGSYFQNLLPASMGGKLTYASGHSETFPHVWQNGASVKILGEENSLLKLGGQDLKFLFDLDYWPTQKNMPIIYHTGFEWFPVKFVALRAGIDQDVAGDGTGTSLAPVSNLTLGTGLKFSGFSFDYAYHQYVGAPDVTNNFFSLSYQPELVKAKPVKANGQVSVLIFEPSDKTVTFSEKAVIKGQVFDPNIKTVEVDKNMVSMNVLGSFETERPLTVGKNKIEIVSYDERGKLHPPVDDKKIGILRLQSFPDVPQDYWVAQPVSLLAMDNIITGYADGSFKPEGNITRAEMCSLLMRSNEGRVTSNEARYALPVTKFKDVNPTHWAAKFISDAAAIGVVKGYAKGYFKPSANISRAEGLSMIARFAGIVDEMYANNFTDISSEHWAAQTIAGADKAGILKYLQGKAFEPNRKLTRAEVVEMLYKTQKVKNLIEKDLLN